MPVHRGPTGIDATAESDGVADMAKGAAAHPGLRTRSLAVIVMGVSGSGKSTLGAMLAASLGCSFLEGDLFHDAAAVATMRAGRALTDEDRWPWLDRLGAAIAAAVATDGRSVAACSALKRIYRGRLMAAIDAPARFILLDSGEDELLRRLESRTNHYMPPSLLASQLATLERPDPTEPALTLDGVQSPEQLCREAVSWLVKASA